MRVAAVDCGTNSLRLLIADVSPGGGCHDVHRLTRIVRLGEGVDETGRLAPAAMDRALAVVAEYAEAAKSAGASRRRFVATSAMRGAANAAEFSARVAAVLGVAPEVVDGTVEAELSFIGATHGLATRGVIAPDEDCLVVDLGGGSTEVVRGSVATGVRAACSVDLGSVRLTERLLRGDPPRDDELAAAYAEVDARLDDVAREVEVAGAAHVVGVAGTVTTLTAYALGLDRYDSAVIDGAVLDLTEVSGACRAMVAMTVAERSRLGYIPAGRADVIGAGALIWGRLLDRVAAQSDISRVICSEHDILDGIALSLEAAQDRDAPVAQWQRQAP